MNGLANDAQPLLTTAHVARELGVSENAVRLIVDRGELPATRTANGMRLFDPEDVARVARERAARKASKPCDCL